MRNILVTAISGDIGNGILKILREGQDILFGCDINKYAVGMDMVEKFFQSKLAVDENYIEELLDKCKKYNISHIIPTNEREIEVIDKNRHLFESIGIKLVIQDSNVLEVCLDKFLTIKKLTEAEIGCPNTYLIDNAKLDDEKLYICKPRRSNGSRDLVIIHGKELEEKAHCLKDNVIQEYIDSEEEFTVGVFAYREIVNIISFRRQLKNGYTNQVELIKCENIEAIARKIASILNLRGYINIQMKKKDEKYYIFEINPRISGTVRFRYLLGYNDVNWWLDTLDGKDISKYECSIRKAVGLRELNEKYVILEK